MDKSMDENRLSLAYLDLREVPANVLQKHSKNVKVLDLSNNKFSDFRFLENFASLHTLILDNNEVKSHTKFPCLHSLQTLWLNKNRISNLTVFIENLSFSFPNLTFLSMMNNPAAPSYFNGGTYQQYIDYRQYVMIQIPTLENIDDKPVGIEEKLEAERIYKHKMRTSSTPKKRKPSRRKNEGKNKDKDDALTDS